MALESFEGGARPEPEKWLCPRCRAKNDFHPEVLRIVEKFKSAIRCQRCDKASTLRAWKGAKGIEEDLVELEERSEAEARDDQEE